MSELRRSHPTGDWFPEVGEPIDPRITPLRRRICDAIEAASDLNDCSKRVAVFLLRLSSRSGECYPSQRYLAHALHKGERTIRRALAHLEKGGYIRRRPRGRGGMAIEFLWREVYEQRSWENPGRSKLTVDDRPAVAALLLGVTGQLGRDGRPPSVRNAATDGRQTRKNKSKEECISCDSVRVRGGKEEEQETGLLRRRDVCPDCKNLGFTVTPVGPAWCTCQLAMRLKTEKGEDYPMKYLALQQECEALKRGVQAATETINSESDEVAGQKTNSGKAEVERVR